MAHELAWNGPSFAASRFPQHGHRARRTASLIGQITAQESPRSNEPRFDMERRKPFDAATRRRIYDRTRGKCHLCHCKLAFKNYGIRGARGAWHVDHSVPIALGGSNHRNNLFAACIGCNLDKSIKSARAMRSKNGLRKAPLDRERFEHARNSNGVAAGAVGATLGASLAGPPGALVGGFFGFLFGTTDNPDE